MPTPPEDSKKDPRYQYAKTVLKKGSYSATALANLLTLIDELDEKVYGDWERWMGEDL
jgi:hypothetical protein